MIGGTFAPLTFMNNEGTDMDLMITTFNTAVTEAVSEMILINIVRRKYKPGPLQKYLVCSTKGEN